MLSTTELRREWSPPCKGPWARIELYGSGVVSVRPEITNAVQALNRCLIAAKYMTRRADTGAYNCRKITGGSGYSLHSYGIAIDINWQSNPYGRKLVTDMPPAMRAAIKGIRTNSGHQVWGWGGDYRTNKDAMHWEIVCTRAQLASGINPSSIPGGTVVKRSWRGFARGATDESIANINGELAEVSELQVYLKLFAEKWSDKSLDPGDIDGDYFDKSAHALVAFKRRMVALQKIAKTKPWTDMSSRVTSEVISAARYWAKLVK